MTNHPLPISKACTQCKQVKPLSAFYPRSDLPGKYYSACKDCRNAGLRAKAAARRIRSSTITPHPDGYALVSLHGKHGEGKFAKVDLQNVELVKGYKWGVNSGGYVRAVVGPIHQRRDVFMHRLILSIDDESFLRVRGDHKNFDTLDNRRDNIRKATALENAQNTRPYKVSSSCFKGVSKARKGNKWAVSIGFHRTVYHLGFYEDETDAARVYDAAAKALFGEFAYTNFSASSLNRS